MFRSPNEQHRLSFYATNWLKELPQGRFTAAAVLKFVWNHRAVRTVVNSRSLLNAVEVKIHPLDSFICYC